MRFVPVKKRRRQGEITVLRTRELLVRQRTQLVNALRGHAAEFGLVVPQGIVQVRALLTKVTADPVVPNRRGRCWRCSADRSNRSMRSWPKLTPASARHAQGERGE